ncbi:hypothetical protein B0H17DRAFT_372883 [Mycena rosella]|uniref:Uncharacterized protein n=1 Tax=Mycena rosella TaxID=1033263 RepID=A0AAD7CPB1_MYCRO|nr:hypothetical protein B0H17DRAFT_372883 [Mycena rosella]
MRTQDRALVIRPNDIWLAILSQFNFFVNARAEILRASFVSHEGKKELVIDTRPQSLRTIDLGHAARQMAGLVEKNVVDTSLRAWATPDFTTTTINDTTVSAVLLMATLKNYFEYKILASGCGIPRVTLEGERSDWVKILNRLEKIKEYGLESIAWYHLLHPVIARFIAAFDSKPVQRRLLAARHSLLAWRQRDGRLLHRVDRCIRAFQQGGSMVRTYPEQKSRVFGRPWSRRVLGSVW